MSKRDADGRRFQRRYDDPGRDEPAPRDQRRWDHLRRLVADLFARVFGRI